MDEFILKEFGRSSANEYLARKFSLQLFDDFLTVIEVLKTDVETAADQKRALTPIEALMRTPPGDEPDQSQEELLDLRELLEDALEVLDEHEREIVLATVVERVPLRTLGRQIKQPQDRRRRYSKSGIAKVRDRAFAKLRERLKDEPMVLEHIANNHAE